MDHSNKVENINHIKMKGMGHLIGQTVEQKVLAGETIDKHIEIITDDGNISAWFNDSKRSLFNDYGSIVRTYGITRRLDKAQEGTLKDALDKAVDYVRKHYHEELNLEQLAKVSGLSKSTLERQFAQDLKTTPFQFVNNVRLENALRLLVNSPLSIAKIGARVGFSDHGHFLISFKARYGEFPGGVRQKQKEGEAIYLAV